MSDQPTERVAFDGKFIWIVRSDGTALAPGAPPWYRRLVRRIAPKDDDE